MKRFWVIFSFAVVFAALSTAGAFVNGDFETGTSTGWTIGGGYRGSLYNNQLTVGAFLPGGANYNSTIAGTHSSIVAPGADPNVGAQLNTVYSGQYSWRVEDTIYGGYASAISQTVTNYTEPNIFFAWAAVLEGAHGTNDAATVLITLTDVTTNNVLITRSYNAANNGGGVDQRFNFTNGFFWTPWQIEQLTLPAASIGDTIQLSILAADCQPTGHAGYLYLDGFGGQDPSGAVPEPGTIGLVLGGLALVGASRLKSKRA